jgi:hypothetical protein
MFVYSQNSSIKILRLSCMRQQGVRCDEDKVTRKEDIADGKFIMIQQSMVYDRGSRTPSHGFKKKIRSTAIKILSRLSSFDTPVSLIIT